LGAVSRKVFWQIADHFLKTSREKEIGFETDLLSHKNIREELRAEEILKDKITQTFVDKTYHQKGLAQYETEEVIPRYSYISPEKNTIHEPIQEPKHEKEYDYGPSF
jgi:hypothetical protein